MASITFNICDFIFSVALPPESRLYSNIMARYKNFIVSSKNNPGIHLNIKIATFPRSQTPRINAIKNKVLFKGPGLRCALERKKRLLYGKAIINDSIYSFDTLLRLILSKTLLDKKGFLIHACGLSIGNKGMLLPGKSGSGKTTLSKKIPPNLVLSDELVCVRYPYLISTPFRGEFGTPGMRFRQKLNGIYFLNKDSVNKITPIPKNDALKELLKLILFFSDNTRDSQILLNSASRCIMKISCNKIYLTKKIKYEGIKSLFGRK